MVTYLPPVNVAILRGDDFAVLKGPFTFGDAANASLYAAGYIMVISSSRVELS